MKGGSKHKALYQLGRYLPLIDEIVRGRRDDEFGEITQEMKNKLKEMYKTVKAVSFAFCSV